MDVWMYGWIDVWMDEWMHACMHACMYVCTLHTNIQTLHYITLHYITIHYITLYYITLHYTTLHYITLHCIHNIITNNCFGECVIPPTLQSANAIPFCWSALNLVCLSSCASRLSPGHPDLCHFFVSAPFVSGAL